MGESWRVSGMSKAGVFYAEPPGENDLDPTFCMVGRWPWCGGTLGRASSFSVGI